MIVNCYKGVLIIAAVLCLLQLRANPCFAQEPEKQAKDLSKDEALRILKEAFSEDPSDEARAKTAELFKSGQQDFLAPLLGEVLKEAHRKEKLLDYIYRRIRHKSIIPDIVDFARNEEGSLRLWAVLILRKLGDKRAVPVLIEKCIYDPYEKRRRERMAVDHLMVSSVFINSAMALYALTDGQIGIKPSKAGRVEVYFRIAREIDKKKSEILDECKKWWAENKEEFFKELEKEYGAEEAKRYIEAVPKKPDNKEESAPKGKKPEKKEPSPTEETNKDTGQDLTPDAEREKPPPVEEPKPDTESSGQRTEPGRELLTVSLIVLGVVIAGLVVFLLINRKRGI